MSNEANVDVNPDELMGDSLYEHILSHGAAGMIIDLGLISDVKHDGTDLDCIESIEDRLGKRKFDVTFLIGAHEDNPNRLQAIIREREDH
jgi:hypothetical protein